MKQITFKIKVINKSKVVSIDELAGHAGINFKNPFVNPTLEFVNYLRKNEEETIEVEIYHPEDKSESPFTYHYVHIAVKDDVVTITDVDC